MKENVLKLLATSLIIAGVIILFLWYPYNPLFQFLMLALIIAGILAPYFLTSFLKRTASFCISLGAMGKAIPDLLLKELSSDYISIKELMIEYSDTVSIWLFILAGLCLLLDTLFPTKNPADTRKERRAKLRQQIQTKLNENKQIFNTYGPYSSNSHNPLTDAHKMWDKSVKKNIIPNNLEIVTLLEKNSDLLTTEELNIFHKFKIHKEGFEHNKTTKNKNSSVPLFPQEISEILK